LKVISYASNMLRKQQYNNVKPLQVNYVLKSLAFGIEAKFCGLGLGSYGLGLEGPGLGLDTCTDNFSASPSNSWNIIN